MNKEQIEKIVIETLVGMLGVEEEKVTMEANIVNDLGADSLDVVELIMEAESDFDIEITNEEAEEMKTVQNAIDVIHRIKSR